MKNSILILLIITVLVSCKKPEIEIPTKHTRIIKNNSIHSIKIKNLYGSNVISINKNEKFEDNYSSDGTTPPKTFGFLISESDSLEVIYNDTLSIFHGSNNYTVKRDLRRNDIFILTEEKIGESDHFTYTYTFTDADFREADSIIN